MAEKRSFPRLPIAHWWTLRRKFKQSLPGVVTDNYIATVLNMGANSARANVLPFLRTLGIIDEDGKTGERATKWRDDSRYTEVCKDIAQEVYPNELREAVPNPSDDRGAAERWFAHSTGAGEVAAKMMAGLYTVLVEADVSKEPKQGERSKKKTIEREVPRPKHGAETPREMRPAKPIHRENSGSHSSQPTPEVNINVQVHISADATSDQIDQIFASMAKHIYRRG